MTHRQITYSPEVVTLPEATSRDANNVQRSWRRFKGYWLVGHPAKLERLLGRDLSPRKGMERS